MCVCVHWKQNQRRRKAATTRTQRYNLWACRPIQQLMPVRRFGRVSRQLYELEMIFVCVRSLSCETMITIMRQCICYDDTVTIARMPDGKYWFHWNREFSVISDRIRRCAVCLMFLSFARSLSISLCLTRSICGHIFFSTVIYLIRNNKHEWHIIHSRYSTHSQVLRWFCDHVPEEK